MAPWLRAREFAPLLARTTPTDVSAPVVALILKTETSLEVALATYVERQGVVVAVGDVGKAREDGGRAGDRAAPAAQQCPYRQVRPSPRFRMS